MNGILQQDYIVDPELESDVNPVGKWERIKYEVVRFSRKYANQKAQERKDCVKTLKHRLNAAQKKLACIKLSSDNAVKHITNVNTRISTIQHELDNYMNLAARGAILRSKINWHNDGEHSFQIFL